MLKIAGPGTHANAWNLISRIPCLRLPTTIINPDAPAKESAGTSSWDLRTFIPPDE